MPRLNNIIAVNPGEAFRVIVRSRPGYRESILANFDPALGKSWTVANKTLDAGTSVALTFTFYDTAGNSIGTMTETVSVGEQGMSEVFRVEFPSDEMVGGYGYTVTIL